MNIDYDKLLEKAAERKEALTALELVLVDAVEAAEAANKVCEFLRHLEVAIGALDAESFELLPPQLRNKLKTNEVANACRIAEGLEILAAFAGAKP